MKLKPKYKSKDQIPTGQESFYVESGGEWVLELDGAPTGFVEANALEQTKAAVKEFREKNIELLKQISQFDGLTPEQVTKLKQEREDALKAAGKIDELVESRVTTMKADFDKTKTQLEQQVSGYQATLTRVMVDDALATVAAKKGIRPSALLDFKNRGRGVFKLQGEAVLAFDGDKPKYGADGKPLTMEEWTDSLATEAPHLFQNSAGGGASGGSGGSGHTGPNPYKKETWNLTQQAFMERDKPALAKSMAAEAGVALK